MKRMYGSEISFVYGILEFSDDLREIDTNYNNLTILDDLMIEAKKSPIVARLFTQGRHRNASTVLLLQNMFPEGKYNTDISRNAQYIALFRSPSNRKQIGIVGERIFDKHRDRFITAYSEVTREPMPDFCWWTASQTHLLTNKFYMIYLVLVEHMLISTAPVRSMKTNLHWTL